MSAGDDNVRPGLLSTIATKVVGRSLPALVMACACAFGDEVAAQQPPALGDPVDVSQDFQRMEQVYFVGSRVKEFDPARGRGTLQWNRYLRSIKDHSVVPHVKVAQSTADIDWKNVELRVFGNGGGAASGLFALPEGEVQTLSLNGSAGTYALQGDPLRGRVNWRATRFPLR